jgi:hypothetical protein
LSKNPETETPEAGTKGKGRDLSRDGMAFGIPGYFGRDPDRIPDPLIPGSRTKTIRVKDSGLLVLLRDT